jgi:hypothetical protein
VGFDIPGVQLESRAELFRSRGLITGSEGGLTALQVCRQFRGGGWLLSCNGGTVGQQAGEKDEQTRRDDG